MLHEDIHVPGITRPLAHIVPSTNIDEKEQPRMTDSSKRNDTENNLHKFYDSVLKSAGAQEESNLEHNLQMVSILPVRIIGVMRISILQLMLLIYHLMRNSSNL